MTKRVAFATMENIDNRQKGSVGSSMIRANWLINYWPEAEEFKIGEDYDVIIFQKVYWKEMMKSFHGIKILDICDPDWMEGKPVMEFVEMADACVTSSQALADYIKEFTSKPVVCIPDRVDLQLYPRKKAKHNEFLKSLVWFGYHQNFHYVEPTLEIIHNQKLNLTIVADIPFTPPTGYPGVMVKNVKYQQNSIQDELVRHDAALLPEVKGTDLRGHFKSNNKDVQCWALGLPVIKRPEDLDRLMSFDERVKEANDKRKLVEEEYDVKISVREYQDLIKKLEDEKSVS